MVDRTQLVVVGSDGTGFLLAPVGWKPGDRAIGLIVRGNEAWETVMDVAVAHGMWDATTGNAAQVLSKVKTTHRRRPI